MWQKRGKFCLQPFSQQTHLAAACPCCTGSADRAGDAPGTAHTPPGEGIPLPWITPSPDPTLNFATVTVIEPAKHAFPLVFKNIL